MRRAIEQLDPQPDFVLLDGVQMDLVRPSRCVIHGDARCQAIAAASILAKTSRDQCMWQWDAVYPRYGFGRHKGYGSPEHLHALAAYGPTIHHRFTYEPVRAACGGALRALFAWRDRFHFDWRPAPSRFMEQWEAVPS
jgi:ribonuclease HII